MSKEIISRIYASTSLTPASTIHADLDELSMDEVCHIRDHHEIKKVREVISVYVIRKKKNELVQNASRQCVIEHYKTGEALVDVVKSKKFPDAVYKVAFSIKRDEPELAKHKPKNLRVVDYDKDQVFGEFGLNKQFYNVAWV